MKVLCLHVLFALFFTANSFNVVIDRPFRGELLLLGEPAQLQVHFEDLEEPPPSNFQLCFIHGDFPDAAEINKSPLTTSLQHLCFETGLMRGIIKELPRGYHRLGVYIKTIQNSVDNTFTNTIPIATYVQVIDYKASNVTSSIYSCPTNVELCKQQFVDTVNTPNEQYNATLTAARGYGIYVEKQLIPVEHTRKLITLAERCAFDDRLDTIDGAPTIQVDLWHQNAGIPNPNIASLHLTSEIFLTVMPIVLTRIQSMYPWEHKNITCTDAFLRRYRPGERLGVKAHQDTSDITVNCLLSSSENDFSSGFPYRFISEYEIDIIPTLQGDCIFHAGQVKHGVVPTEVGTRYTLILFWKVLERMKGSTSYEVGDKNPGIYPDQ